jgi:hypothetical protein
MPDDVVLPFDRSEYADRLARTRASMERRRLECLLVTDPSNMYFLGSAFTNSKRTIRWKLRYIYWLALHLSSTISFPSQNCRLIRRPW